MRKYWIVFLLVFPFEGLTQISPGFYCHSCGGISSGFKFGLNNNFEFCYDVKSEKGFKTFMGKGKYQIKEKYLDMTFDTIRKPGIELVKIGKQMTNRDSIRIYFEMIEIFNSDTLGEDLLLKDSDNNEYVFEYKDKMPYIELPVDVRINWISLRFYKDNFLSDVILEDSMSYRMTVFYYDQPDACYYSYPDTKSYKIVKWNNERLFLKDLDLKKKIKLWRRDTWRIK